MKEKSLAKLNQENLELRKENEALQETVTKLLGELDRLIHLPAPLHVVNSSNSITIPGTAERMERSTELTLVEEQIELLYATSRNRMLSLEETRALDLLIKNKRLLEPKADHEPEWKKVSESTKESDLLRLADASSENRETDSGTKTSS